MSPGLVSGMIIGDMLDSYSGLLIFSVVVELQNSGYPRNPAKFTKYYEICELKVLSNTCQCNIFETHLGYWGCRLHHHNDSKHYVIPKLPGVN